MAMYLDEEEIWKCPKHPSKRRRSNGVCPVCLKDKLVILCPECANIRPCACYTSSSSSSSSSASSSFSLFSVRSAAATSAAADGGVGSTGRVSSLINSEPAFRRSSSVGIPFLRSSYKNSGDRKIEPKSNKTASFWSVFKFTKGKKSRELETEELKGGTFCASDYSRDVCSENHSARIEDFARMMMRSRSMSVEITSAPGGDDVSKPSKGWHFPSPMKVFRQSKASKLVYERSPLYRG